MVKPVFSAVAAVTLDGKIAAYRGQNSTWTSPEDKKFLHEFLDHSDVILVGRTTYEAAIKPLSKRNCIILTSRVETTIQKNPRTLFCNANRINLVSLVQRLGYKKVAVLGGQQVYAFCLKYHLLDELFLTIEPIVFGRGLDLFGPRVSYKKRFRLISTKQLNKAGSILLHYKL